MRFRKPNSRIAGIIISVQILASAVFALYAVIFKTGGAAFTVAGLAVAAAALYCVYIMLTESGEAESGKLKLPSGALIDKGILDDIVKQALEPYPCLKLNKITFSGSTEYGICLDVSIVRGTDIGIASSAVINEVSKRLNVDASDICMLISGVITKEDIMQK